MRRMTLLAGCCALLALGACGVRDLAYWHADGVSLEKQHKDREALESYKKAQALAPEDFSVLHNLGNVCWRLGDWAAARVWYAKALVVRRDAVDTWCGLGMAWLKLKDRERAAEAFRRGLEKDPGHADCAVAWSAALLEDGKPEEAARVIEGAVKTTTNDARLYVNLAFARLESGKPAAAAQACASALRAQPESVTARILLAEARLAAGDRDGALIVVRELAKAGDKHPRLALLEARLLAADAAGGSAAQAARARAALQALVLTWPDNGAAWLALGEFHGATGAWGEAYAAFQRAVNIDYKKKVPRLRLAEALVRLKRHREAQRALAAIAKAYPEDREVLGATLRVLVQLGDFERAVPVGQKLLGLDRDDKAAQVLTGIALLRSQDDGVRDVKKGVDLLWPRRSDTPPDKDLLRWLLRGLVELGDTGRAAEVRRLQGAGR